MAQATGAANRILSMRPNTTTAPTYPALHSPNGGVSIDFQNVSFTYKTRDTPVLSNLNLHIAPGQFAAFVGASGSGKTTTISLLERFYDASSGVILFNGQDVTTLDPSLYRQHLSLVSQEPILYEGTIRDNIALSVATATDAEITAACTSAQIHDFIASLPDAYATRLGPKGMSLSGGQKQRLSLARALLRKPALLLLDEATSSLDSESEKLVQDAIERAAGARGRTVIAVAHRLATVQKADVIFVMGSGRVLERGSHQELLRVRGVYWQMVSFFVSNDAECVLTLVVSSAGFGPIGPSCRPRAMEGRWIMCEYGIYFEGLTTRLIDTLHSRHARPFLLGKCAHLTLLAVTATTGQEILDPPLHPTSPSLTSNPKQTD